MGKQKGNLSWYGRVLKLPFRHIYLCSVPRFVSLLTRLLMLASRKLLCNFYSNCINFQLTLKIILCMMYQYNFIQCRTKNKFDKGYQFCAQGSPSTAIAVTVKCVIKPFPILKGPIGPLSTLLCLNFLSVFLKYIE